MDMRHPDGVRVKNVYLPRGSLLVMEGAARYEWSHGIASRKTDMVRACDHNLRAIPHTTETSLLVKTIETASSFFCTSVVFKRLDLLCIKKRFKEYCILRKFGHVLCYYAR